MTNLTASHQPGLPARHAHDAPAELTAMSDGIVAMVDLAAGLSMGARRVDLTGLDHAVGLLCAKALDLQPAEGRAARAGLCALLARIDALSVALRTDRS